MKTNVIEDKSYWANHVECYCSGAATSKMAYCRQAKINYHRFLYWYQKIIKEQVNKGKLPREALFMPVKMAVKQSNQHHNDHYDVGRNDHRSCQNNDLLCSFEFKQGHKLMIYNESVLQNIVNMLGV